MFQESSQPQPLATWNPARSVWETSQESICGHLMPFSQTLPRSGSMRTGRLYQRPAWVPRTNASVGSVLPTPRASRGASSTETVALLPTPGKADGDGGHEIPLLPTPEASRAGGTAERHLERKEEADGSKRTKVTNLDILAASGLIGDFPLLPTPAVNDMGAAYTPETWDEWTATMKAKHNNGNGHGKSLNVEAQRLLPTPTRRDHKDTEVRREPHRPDDVDTLARALTDVLLPTPRATDGTKGGPNQRGSSGDLMLPSAVSSLLPTPTAADSKASGASGCDSGHDGTTLTDATVRQPAKWGEYEPAIRRWEAVTRPAPEPTKANAKGNPKLSDEFDEWLMGYPAGWITNVPGVTWNEVLKACGNGVVPQQGAAAIRWLLTMGVAA